MASKFLDEVRKRAREVANGCPLMDGRTKGDPEEFIDMPLTISEAFRLNGDNGSYYVVVVQEYPDLFFLSGGGLTTVLEQADIVADKNNVSLTEAAEGLTFKYGKKIKTKNNRDFRPVTVL